MTIRAVTLSTLKVAKNAVIGNPTAKLALASDETFIGSLVDCIHTHSPSSEDTWLTQDDIRIEAAHVIASLSYGSPDTLKTLLRYNAHQAFIYAISYFRPSEPPKLKAAFARALRALAVSIANAVGPAEWGLCIRISDIRNEAKVALDYFFQAEVLDIYLPLLVDPSLQVRTSIAQLLASAIRTPKHRTLVSQWLPLGERISEVKGKRGWEKPDVARSPSRQGGWVSRSLVTMLQTKDSKLQNSVLCALACLAKGNSSVAVALARPAFDRPATLSYVLALCKSRSADLRLASSLCAVEIIRAAGLGNHSLTADDSPALTVMYVVNRFIESESDSAQTRMKACFILAHLVTDNKELCDLAYIRGSLRKLAVLIKQVTPEDKTSEWEEDEPESVSSLREAALIAVAAVSLFNDDIRCDITDNLKLIPAIKVSLAHPHVGVRYGACQCVRAISRSVAVLRTNIVDSGLGMAVYQLFTKADEDRRVIYAASCVVCNLVNDCSPLRTDFMDQGLLPKLGQLLNSGESGLRLNALWALKNLLYHSSVEIKQKVMDVIGWQELASLFMDVDPGVQEQAFHVVRHLADGADDVEMVFNELGSDTLLGFLAVAIEAENEDVQQQAVCVLANLANSSSHQDNILSNSRIMAALRQCLVDAPVRIRRPAVGCILELVRANPRSYKSLHDAGIDLTLRHMCEYSGGAISGSPTTPFSPGLYKSIEDEVRDHAREALHWLEHNVEMGV